MTAPKTREDFPKDPSDRLKREHRLQVWTDTAHYTWFGGPYIDVVYNTPKGGHTPHDVISVWDYEAGKPSIPVTLDALVAVVTEHEEIDRLSINNDKEN